MASHHKHHDDAVLPGEDLEYSSCDEDEDEDDDDEEEEPDDVLVSPSPPTSSAAASATVTIALPAMVSNGEPAIPISSSSSTILASTAAIAAAARPEERKPQPIPVDDSRKLFQRLWTDEDEIELLQGFLDYSSQRGSRPNHHGQNDTALFYDQIKSRLQLEFNKNQLVEKLRRLKKKYRNIVGKISAGKEVSFKSPHDQATFDISRKIWTNIGFDTAMDDDDPGPAGGPSNFVVEVRGDEAAAALGGFAFERRAAAAALMAATATPRSRKRPRPKLPDPRFEERRVGGGGAFVDNYSTPIAHNSINHSGGGGGGGGVGHNNSTNGGDFRGLVEEAVKSCLSPLFKELSGSVGGGTSTSGGLAGHCTPSRTFGGLAANPVPMSYGVPSMNLGMFTELASASAVVAGDERWRKQQILELEVYSKRLELVQDQVKAALDDLRSKGGS